MVQLLVGLATHCLKNNKKKTGHRLLILVMVPLYHLIYLGLFLFRLTK